jgi:lipopolysaccharide export system permease protein
MSDTNHASSSVNDSERLLNDATSGAGASTAAPAASVEEAGFFQAGGCMKTVQRMIYNEVLAKVSFATMGFVGLFFFFDLADELKWIGKGPGQGYAFEHAVAYVLLLVPSHIYELLPITVLIGTIFVMAKFAQTSEFTILRTSGMGPQLALRHLLILGMAFVVLTFVIGDYVAPPSSRVGQLLRTQHLGMAYTQGVTGAWLKETQEKGHSVVNVGSISPQSEMGKVRIFEFDDSGRLNRMLRADKAVFETNANAWTLQNVSADYFNSAQSGMQALRREQLPSFRWTSAMTEEMVSVALLKPERMATLDLFRYIQHLSLNNQSSQRYEIEFWKKLFYPLSCLVMVMLALPFAYLHLRSTPITSVVFLGILIGISFFLMNNVFGHIGNLNAWPAWLAAATPGILYMLISMLAFTWLVLRH